MIQDDRAPHQSEGRLVVDPTTSARQCTCKAAMQRDGDPEGSVKRHSTVEIDGLIADFDSTRVVNLGLPAVVSIPVDCQEYGKSAVLFSGIPSLCRHWHQMQSKFTLLADGQHTHLLNTIDLSSIKPGA